MATLTITIGSFSDSKTISNADITRIVDAQKKVANNPALTNTQAFDMVVVDIHRMLKHMVRSVEGNTAVEAITPVAIT